MVETIHNKGGFLPDTTLLLAGGHGFGPEEIDNSKQLGLQQSALSRAITEVLTGFDLWLQRHRSRFVIDMYITKPENPAAIVPIDQETALKRFRAHIAEIDQDPSQLLAGGELVRANLVSIITYCEEEARVAAGEPKMPYDLYLPLVSGVKPQLIPYVELRANRKDLVEKVHMTGFPIPDDENNLDALKVALGEYQEKNKVTSRGSIEAIFKRFFSRYRVQLGAILGEDLSSVNFEMVWRDRNEFWMMWERVEMDGDRLWANWNPRHRNNWDMGTIERYAIHEPAHFIAAHLMRQEIRAGRLDPAAGLLPIPSPACLKEEGVAQTLDELAGLKTTLDCQVSVASYRLEKRALVNGLYRVEQGEPIAEVVGAIRNYMPLKNDEGIGQLLIEGTTKPFERAYLPLYGLSDYALMSMLRRIGPEGMRNVLLSSLLRKPMTRAQLMTPTLNLDS